MSEVERSGRGRRSAEISPSVRAAGIGLLVLTLALIILGPFVMSQTISTALQSVCVIGGVAYGIYLAAHSRSRQIALERAYSTHLEELSQRLRNMAYRDAVTGLYNHRYFREQLQHEVERSSRYGTPLSLVLLDMNNFKEINDRYGHFMGDRFLGMVGEVIARQVRSSDVGARYGGDEFVIILPSTSFEEARATAEKLALAVANCAAMTSSGEPVQLGISFGVASCPDEANTPSSLIERADGRLYEAKALRKPSRRYSA
jgi:diguanylate cyclase (GGDEF)-like protein